MLGFDIFAGLAGFGAKSFMKEGSSAAELVEALAQRASAAKSLGRFAEPAANIVRDAPAYINNFGTKMAFGGIGGYAVGSGIDWATNDNRWAGRLATLGTMGGAGLGIREIGGVKMLGEKFNSAFEYAANKIKGAHKATSVASKAAQGVV